MPTIRHVEINNFRSIRRLRWAPSPGINCLIGPGDSGKSTILDAIEMCLSARRSISFSDSDFYNLDCLSPIIIRITLGDLPHRLKDVDAFGLHLRGYEPVLETISDEPCALSEVVLTIELTVDQNLEGSWRLYSDRSAADDRKKDLPWADRIAIAPARLGSQPLSSLSLARGSTFSRMIDDKVDVRPELAQSLRAARAAFGESATVQLGAPLKKVTEIGQGLGVPVGEQAKALLDIAGAAWGSASVALHSADGIPLRNLGTGSTRLLLSGLHRHALNQVNCLIVDEVELGLEPHRLTGLLHSLGSKEAENAPQVFMTTHSPVALRELSGSQLYILRTENGEHLCRNVGSSDDVQSTLRLDPEAFLSKLIFVCEGASEVGFVRGLDLYFSKNANLSMHSKGISFVNAQGGSPEKCLERATALRKLGYEVVAFIDNDKPADSSAVSALIATGANLISWPPGLALEDVLFQLAPKEAVDEMIVLALEFVTEDQINSNLTKAAGPAINLAAIQAARSIANEYSQEHRRILGLAARTRKAGFFKSVSKMERLAESIAAPRWSQFQTGFSDTIKRIYSFVPR